MVKRISFRINVLRIILVSIYGDCLKYTVALLLYVYHEPSAAV